jgi:hypothetical protein
LTLETYKLSDGHIKALAKIFAMEPEFANRFVFDNCGLSDRALEVMFDSMVNLKRVVSLVLKQNELGLKGTAALTKVLTRPFPATLQELSIVNCKLT